MDGIGGLDLAVGGVAISSSDYGSGYNAINAFDGSSFSFWIAARGAELPQFIGYEFSEPVKVEAIGIQPQTGREERAPKNYVVQYSNDGEIWFDDSKFGEIYEEPWGSEEWRYRSPQLKLITGNCTTEGGGKVVTVFVFKWQSGDLLAKTSADSGGSWSVEVPVGEVGVTYMAKECHPITHGPYYLEVGGGTEPLPTVIGEASNGGFYAGDIEDGGKWYKLIVADVEAEVYGLLWGDYGTDLAAAKSTTDGPAITEAMRGTATYEAGNHCLDYRGGGFDDWYMPARSELQAIYENLGHDKTPPAGFESGGTQAFDAGYYWCSTQKSSIYAGVRRFSDGNDGNVSKDYKSIRVRPVRRLEFTT